MHNIHYFAELLHSLEGKAFDNEPPKLSRSNLAEDGEEEAEEAEFEVDGPVISLL